MREVRAPPACNADSSVWQVFDGKLGQQRCGQGEVKSQIQRRHDRILRNGTGRCGHFHAAARGVATAGLCTRCRRGCLLHRLPGSTTSGGNHRHPQHHQSKTEQTQTAAGQEFCHAGCVFAHMVNLRRFAQSQRPLRTPGGTAPFSVRAAALGTRPPPGCRNVLPADGEAGSGATAAAGVLDWEKPAAWMPDDPINECDRMVRRAGDGMTKAGEGVKSCTGAGVGHGSGRTGGVRHGTGLTQDSG